MSMRSYAFDDYGVVITTEMIDAIKEKLKLKEDLDYYDIGEEIDAEYSAEFEGEAQLVLQDGSIDYADTITFDNGSFYYFPIRRYGTLFAPAFSSMEELVTEMKYWYGKYLPEDFEYEKNIRHIVGTYYG